MTFGSQVLIMVHVRALARSDPRLCRHRHARPRRLLRHRRLYGRRSLAARSAGASRSAACSPAALVAGLVGFIFGWFLLRYRGLTLLMLTLATAIMLQETGNLRSDLSGGYDGLPGLTFDPLLGIFRLRSLRPHQLSLRARRAGGRVLFRAPHRLFAVRPGAHRHPRKRAAHACDRLAGAPPAGDGLHHCGRRSPASPARCSRRPMPT